MAEAMSEEAASSWNDDAPITDEQIEAVRIGLGNGSDGVPVYYQFSRAVVRKMLAEVDRLRAQLAEIGETREEWQVVYLTHAQNMFYNGYTEPTRHEQSARSWMTDFLRNNPGRGATLMHRYRGEWREVEPESNHG